MEIIESDVEGGAIIDSDDDEVGYFWSDDPRASDARDFFSVSGRVIRVLGDGRGNGWVSAATGQPLADAVVAEPEAK
jgi:hypothetical protein